jgi:hypothetical protein
MVANVHYAIGDFSNFFDMNCNKNMMIGILIESFLHLISNK